MKIIYYIFLAFIENWIQVNSKKLYHEEWTAKPEKQTHDALQDFPYLSVL
jgi:hypothetical protein